MAKARVLGNQAVIQITQPNGSVISVGEVDKFSAKSLSDVMKSHPLGDGEITSQIVFKGWDLEFEGGLVDFQLIEDILQLQDVQTANKGRSPYVTVVQTITYFDGTTAQYKYNNVTLSEYSLDASSAEEQVKQSFKGFCGSKREKVVSATTASAGTAAANNAIFTALLKATSDAENRGATVTLENLSD